MDRRDFLASSIALAFVGVLHARAPRPPSPAPEAARARALYDAIFEHLLGRCPQTATALGLDTGGTAAARSRLTTARPPVA